jgi:hypothetical protein
VVEGPRESPRGLEDRRGKARRNKRGLDGPGNCGRERRGPEVAPAGEGGPEGGWREPGSSWGRQSSWPPAALCSWLRNVPGLPGDGLAPAAPVPH